VSFFLTTKIQNSYSFFVVIEEKLFCLFSAGAGKNNIIFFKITNYFLDHLVRKKINFVFFRKKFGESGQEPN
jgi:hypothetical protein